MIEVRVHISSPSQAETRYINCPLVVSNGDWNCDGGGPFPPFPFLPPHQPFTPITLFIYSFNNRKKCPSFNNFSSTHTIMGFKPLANLTLIK